MKERKKLEQLLLVACERGLLDDARQLVHLSGVYQFDLVRDRRGRTPMHLAAARGRTDVLEFLWSKAADLDAEDEDGRTPLHLAAANGHVECVRLLVDRGGVFLDGTEGKWGMTAMEMAACVCQEAGGGQEAVIRLLVERGAKCPQCPQCPEFGGDNVEGLLRVGRGCGDKVGGPDGGRSDVIVADKNSKGYDSKITDTNGVTTAIVVLLLSVLFYYMWWV